MREDPSGLFAGRGKETRRILEALEAGTHLVLAGPVGIGKSALLRHAARLAHDSHRFLFLQGDALPARATEALYVSLFPEQARRPGRKGIPPGPMRRDISARPQPDPKPLVAVLDGVAKITPQRLDFLRWLREAGRFQVLAATDPLLSEDEIWRLRVALAPAPLLRLEYLTPAETSAFFVAWADQKSLAWDPPTIHGMVQATHGYPLNMVALAQALTPG